MKQSTRQPGNAVIWAAMFALLLVWFLPNVLREVREVQRLLRERNRLCEMIDSEMARHKKLQKCFEKPHEHWKPWRYIQPKPDEKIFRFEAKNTSMDL